MAPKATELFGIRYDPSEKRTKLKKKLMKILTLKDKNAGDWLFEYVEDYVKKNINLLPEESRD